MKRSPLFPLLRAAILLAGMSGCSSDPLMETGDLSNAAFTPVTIGFQIDPMSVAGDTPPAHTRIINGTGVSGGDNVEDNTGDNTDNYVKNMWVFQFEGTGTTAVLRMKQYVSTVTFTPPKTPITDPATAGKADVKLLETLGNNQRLLVVTNVSATDVWPAVDGANDFADVVAVTQTISSEANTHTLYDEVETIVMSGVLNSSTGIAYYKDSANKVPLKRSIAKLTVNFTVATGYQVTSLRLHNVANQLSYASGVLLDNGANAMNGAAPTFYPANTVATINYAAESKNLPITGGGTTATSYTWYLPANKRGTSSSTTSKAKTGAATTADLLKATYIEFMVEKTGSPDEKMTYKLYPGANMTNDYNLLSDTHYTFNLTVLGVYLGEDDTRGVAIISPAANSYMLHPSTTKRVSINIPLSRINEYWDGGSNGHGTAANKLAVGDTWTASILWSDITAINQAAIDIYVPKHTGSYVEEDYFTVALPSTYSGGTGNFVVQVKNTNNVVLWSWHIWVTDYNPDSAGEALTVNGYKSRTGGQVEMYDGATVMMDRNLGQIEQYPAYPSGDGSTSRGILHYQFGRKDPFPTYTSAPLSSNTVDITTYDGTSPQSIATSVQHPLTFIKGSNSSYNWCSENGDTGYLWNDPTVTSYTTSASKSLYDPCPPGWRVPAIGVWNNLGDGSSSGVSLGNSNSAWNDPKSPGLNYPKTTPYSFYAAAGFRNNSAGGLGYVGMGGYSWSASPFSSTYGQSLFSSNMYVYPQNSYYRAGGFSVRCSQAK